MRISWGRSTWQMLVLAPALAGAANAQVTSPTPATASDADAWSLHGQTTIVEQWHGPFHSPYSGLNSLGAGREDRHTVTLTGFLGRRVWPGGELFYNPEVSQGTGLSGTVGAAGFPNGEATRAGTDTPEYNTARLFLRQTIGLGGGRETGESSQNQAAGAREVERLTFTLGKLSATDIFDSNRYSHDPRTQFLNWALMANGAWDYPADTKGYTGGFTAEWNQASRALRWGAFMEPREANGRPLDPKLSRALGQAFEWEERYRIGRRPGALRALVFWNRANMGSYAAATRGSAPDITLRRSYSSKAGAGLNWEQELSDDVGMFARAGFNDGRNETWAFTEIDRTLSGGVSLGGKRWGRADDRVGVAAVVNGLAAEHRRYLAAGGYGFIVGDGRLRYGPEEIVEAFYDLKPWRWLDLTLDAQLIAHPGYNRDRGPVSVFAVRTHCEF